MLRRDKLQDYSVVTIAGSGCKGCSDGSLTEVAFNGPSAIIQLSPEVSLVADTAGNALRVVDFKAGAVSTLDTTELANYGPAILSPRSLCKLEINGVHGIVVAESGRNRLIFVSGESGRAEILAGTSEASCLNGDFLQSTFNAPHCVITDQQNGLLYVSDTKNHCIRVLSLKTRKVRVLAGSPGIFGYKDGSSALFNEPLGLLLTEDANIVVCDSKNGALRYISRQDGEVITLVGKPNTGLFKAQCIYSYNNSLANQQYLSKRRAIRGNYATFNLGCPHSITAIDSGLLITDVALGRLYLLDFNFEIVTCLNPDAPGAGYLDGPLQHAMFLAPSGMTRYKDGVLVADSGANRIRYITFIALKVQREKDGNFQERMEVSKPKEGIDNILINTCTYSSIGSTVGKLLPTSTINTLTSSSAEKPIGPIDGTKSNSIDMMASLIDPSTLRQTREIQGPVDLSVDSNTSTASYIKDLLNEPYPTSVLTLEIYDLLLTHFLSTGTYHQTDKTARHKKVEKQPPAKIASNLTTSNSSMPAKTLSSLRTAQCSQSSSVVGLSLYNSDYPLDLIFQVCVVISSRIFDASQQVFIAYGKNISRYIRSFDPLLFASKVIKDNREVHILENTKKGVLRALAMATNLPVFSSNLLLEDGLRAEYHIVTGHRGTRVFVLEPKLTSFMLELDINFLADSLFVRYFNNVELVLCCSSSSSSKQTKLITEDTEGQKESVGTGIACPTAKQTRFRTAQSKHFSENSRCSFDTLSDNEGLPSTSDDSGNSDATLFTAFSAFPKLPDDLSKVLKANITTDTFSNATSGLFDYSPHHSIGECTIRLPIKVDACSEDCSNFIKIISQEAFKNLYGVTATDGVFCEVILYLNIVGHRIVESKNKDSDVFSDKIVLCECAQIKIPLLISRSMQSFKAIASKTIEAQELSILPREVIRLEKNIILGVCNVTRPPACIGKQLKDKIVDADSI